MHDVHRCYGRIFLRKWAFTWPLGNALVALMSILLLGRAFGALGISFILYAKREIRHF